jgi:hypothetical protein
MATVRVETVQPEPPPRKVILELTEDEAAAVCIMCGSVGGPMSTPLRRSATDVWLSLHEVFSDSGAMCVGWGSIKPTDHPLPRLR